MVPPTGACYPPWLTRRRIVPWLVFPRNLRAFGGARPNWFADRATSVPGPTKVLSRVDRRLFHGIDASSGASRLKYPFSRHGVSMSSSDGRFQSVA